MRLTTEGVDVETGRVRFVPTLNAGSGDLMGFHRHLLADGVRTGAFVDAIRQAVRPGDCVVDLGTGTGVLAVAAAQAGAGTVIGIERNAIAAHVRALAAANNVRVEVVHGVSDDVNLPRSVDVLVSECLGLAGLGGSMIGAVKRARDRWLKPGGIVIPRRLRVFAAPVEDPEANALVHCWDGARVAGVRLDVLGAHIGHNLYIASFTGRHLLAPPVEVCSADLLAGPLEDAVAGTAKVTATRSGALHGWALWFEADLVDDLVLRTGPLDATTVWQQCFAPVPARRVEAETPIDLTLRFRGRHTGLDSQSPDAEGMWIDWDTAIGGSLHRGSTELSHGAPTGRTTPGDNPIPAIFGIESGSVKKPVPISRHLAAAMVAARSGWSTSTRRASSASGELFTQSMQARIAEKLDEGRMARFLAVRDGARYAVRLVNADDPEAAGKALEDCATRLADFSNDAELHGLARYCIDHAWAHYGMRRNDLDAAEAHLRQAMDTGTLLEQVHGHDAMHIGRVDTARLWLRVREAGGDRKAVLDGANAILAYVNGFGGGMPLGDGWSRRAAAQIPADLAAAMTCRIADEAGGILCGLDPEQSIRSLDRLPMLDRLDPVAHEEIVDWAGIKRAWAEGRADEFLAGVINYLAAGRRKTCLWYGALLDLCRAARGIHPSAGRIFCEKMAKRGAEDPEMPRRLRREFESLTEEPPAVRWTASTPIRTG